MLVRDREVTGERKGGIVLYVSSQRPYIPLDTGRSSMYTLSCSGVKVIPTRRFKTMRIIFLMNG